MLNQSDTSLARWLFLSSFKVLKRVHDKYINYHLHLEGIQYGRSIAGPNFKDDRLLPSQISQFVEHPPVQKRFASWHIPGLCLQSWVRTCTRGN